MSTRANRTERRWGRRYDDQLVTGPARCEVLAVDGRRATVTVGDWDDHARTPQATVRWVTADGAAPVAGDQGYLHVDGRGRRLYVVILATGPAPIAGRVTPAGARVGSGFDVDRVSVGVYEVTYDVGFDAPPALTIQPLSAAAVEHRVPAHSKAGFTVELRAGAALADTAFAFTAQPL